MAVTAGGSVAVSNFPSSSYHRRKSNTFTFTTATVSKLAIFRRRVACSAVQESSTPTVAAKTETKEPTPPSAAAETKEIKEPTPAKAAAAAKPKAPAKKLTELMEEDVIPSLKETLESEDDISELELSFADNRLEGSFLKKAIPYSFWAFFPDGVLTGPKGFSLSSYGLGVSTVEPFLIDEKKITANHVVFWVEKRLAAQGIIPVWKD